MSGTGYNHNKSADALATSRKTDKHSPCPQTGTQAPQVEAMPSSEVRALLSLAFPPLLRRNLSPGTPARRTADQIAAEREAARESRRSRKQFRRDLGRFVAAECGVRFEPVTVQYDPRSAERLPSARTPLTDDLVTAYRHEALANVRTGRVSLWAPTEEVKSRG
jgi:hypothetical protein